MEGGEVFFAGAEDDVGGEGRGGRSLVPLYGEEVVADELFVVARGGAVGAVLVGGPVAGGVGREDLVDEDEVAGGVGAELEFGVGEDHAGGAGFVVAQ